MEFKETLFSGCYIITPKKISDKRGDFIKIFNERDFINYNLGVSIREEYYSISKPGVIRGMHFQLPPKDHFKIVTCIVGGVKDVLVDLRKNSKTYKKCISFELNEENRQCIYIPKGIAHGFYVNGNKDAIMLYCTETVYNSEADFGIRWDSIDYDWKVDSKEIIISEKDSKLIEIDEFKSPF